jgi:hypothetical protein
MSCRRGVQQQQQHAQQRMVSATEGARLSPRRFPSPLRLHLPGGIKPHMCIMDEMDGF